jgi:predicted CoA-substrate-specific enzyme activase
MSYCAGIDVGAGTAKAVILENNSLLGYSVRPVLDNVVGAAEEAVLEALKKPGLSKKNLSYVVSTGYGRNLVGFANKVSSEIICHAKGVYFMKPEARTIIDIGAQDSKIIRINRGDKVIDFAMNDKCAAGTGRFLEVMAGVLGVKLEYLGAVSLESSNPCRISSTCTVFAESEVVILRAQGNSITDLVAGIHRAVAKRIFILGAGIGFENEVILTGGVGKNVGMKRALEEAIGMKIWTPPEPQITGALGAALIAKTEFGFMHI